MKTTFLQIIAAFASIVIFCRYDLSNNMAFILGWLGGMASVMTCFDVVLAIFGVSLYFVKRR